MKQLIRALLAFGCLVPAAASAQYVGSLEFQMGFGGSSEAEPEKGDSVEVDMATPLGITPALESMVGKSVGIGGEWGFVWMKSDDGDEDRHLVMSPHLRLRMSFPVYKKVTFDGMLGIGPSIWTEPEGSDLGTRFGWGLRFNFGGSFQFNDSVAAFANLGYQRSTSYGDDVTLTYSWVPLNVGLRTTF